MATDCLTDAQIICRVLYSEYL